MSRYMVQSAKYYVVQFGPLFSQFSVIFHIFFMFLLLLFFNSLTCNSFSPVNTVITYVTTKTDSCLHVRAYIIIYKCIYSRR